MFEKKGVNIFALGSLLVSLKPRFFPLVVQIHLAIANCFSKLGLTDSLSKQNHVA